MDQATLDADELFGEAATELRDDIEQAVADARAELPDPDAVLAPEGDNLLGELNTLRTTLSTEAADEHLHEARKWLEVGRRSGAIEEDDDLIDEIEAVADKLEAIQAAETAAAELTSALPELRETLQE